MIHPCSKNARSTDRRPRGARPRLRTAALLLEYGDRASPACRGRTNFHGEAGDRETRSRQPLEVVQFLEMAVPDVASRLVALPDELAVSRLLEFGARVDEGRIPTPS